MTTTASTGERLAAPWLFGFLAFWTGLSTMALEILAARVLAPAFGTSTVVWTSVIAVVLLALSLGYVIGGRLAERRGTLVTLARVLVVCGVLVIIAALGHEGIKKLWGHLVPRSLSGSYLVGGSLFSALLLFGVPVLLLGALSPLTLSLAVQGGRGIGVTSGRLYALGTIGGLIGTFLPTFVLVPFVGSTRSMLLLGAILVVLGVVLHPRRARVAAVAAAAIVVLGVTWPGAKARAIESSYQNIVVHTNPDGSKTMLFDATFGWQSVYHPTPRPTGLYFDVIAAAAPMVLRPDRPARILVIGVAGGTMPRQLHHYYGAQVELHGVELDPEVIAIARRDFGLASLPIAMSAFDGRAYMANTDERFDLVVVDVYRNEFELPWSIATQEFWRDVAARLEPGGLVAINVCRPSKRGVFVSAIGDTLASVFPGTLAVDLDETGSTVFLAGAELPRREALAGVPSELLTMAERIRTAPAWTSAPGAALLTDERASPEVLLFSEGARIVP